MKALRCVWLVVLAFAGVGLSHAQYPVKPVRWIVAFPPGGGSDTLARILSAKLSESLGQTIVIDNRPGAGANIGAEIASKAAPDGYTILMGNIAHAINMSLYAKPGYDVVRDFIAVNTLTSTPNVVVVHPSVQVKTLKDLIALAKQKPGQLNMASSGAGSSPHLAGELFNSLAGIRMNHIPYKGGGPAMAALVAGETAVGFATMPSAVGHIKAGKLRALAVTTPKRSPTTPDLPTVVEAGLPGYEAVTWYVLFVPAGTPKPIVTRLFEESRKFLAAPDVKQRLDSTGFEAIGSTPEQAAAFVRAERDKWTKVVRTANIKVD
ncbi:MAG TPA: tripartite tricarboxylate transporter substrate binding protein [Burkholderiales bacterium]|nr:tripartite tricarboxylate transporter substrate binding protein [Burkholderiales bacterium]